MALQAGEREVSLSSRGRAYTIDFTAMQQIDDDTGSPSKVLRQECDVTRGEPCKLENHQTKQRISMSGGFSMCFCALAMLSGCYIWT